jgi:glycerophosphoryl diester phosphodiesterase
MSKLFIIFIVGIFTILNSYADGAYKVVAGKPHDIKQPKYVEIYSHRGARSFAPENVMPGYKAGLKIGVDWVDMDVGLTRDGVLIVDHDIWLNPDILSKNGKFWAKSKDAFYKSISNKNLDKNIQPYLVKNLTVAELKQYEAGILNPDSSYAKYFPDQVAVPGTHMPTVQEVVNYVKKKTGNKVNFQIEVKNDPNHSTWTVTPQKFAKKLYTLMKKNNIINHTEIQSFDWQVLYELQKLDKKIKTAYLFAHDDKDRMLSSDTKKAGSWSGGKLLKNYNNSLPQMIKALGGSCYEPEDVMLTKAQLDEAHRLGLKVVVWSWPEHSGQAFDPKIVKKMIDWGVDGIITDDPGRLASILAARGYPVPRRH